MANGQRGFRNLQDEQEFIRSFVNDPGGLAVTPDLAPAERTLPPRTAESMVRRQQARDIARARSSGGVFQEPAAPPPSREGVRQAARERSAGGLRLQPSATSIQEAPASVPASTPAVPTRSAPTPAARPVGPGVERLGTEGRQFRFTPGAGGGLRGEIGFETAQPGFEERVRQSAAAGAFNSVTPERVESARQVHQANLRGLRGMRQLSAARLGVPEQFLDAVRAGHLTGREAATLGAQQPVARGGRGGLTPAQLLQFQQGERAQGLRERQFSADQQQETNRMLTDEEPAVRNEGRRQAAALYASNPDDPIAQQTMARGASRLLNDLGSPGVLSALWFDRFGGSPQTLLDPDTRASVNDMISGAGLEIDMDFEGRGEPVLLHRGNPVDEWKDILDADPDVAFFLLDAMGIPRRQARRGFRQR